MEPDGAGVSGSSRAGRVVRAAGAGNTCGGGGGLWRAAVQLRGTKRAGQSVGPLSAILGSGRRDTGGALYGALTGNDSEPAGDCESWWRVPAAGCCLSARASAADVGRRAAVGSVDGRSAVGEVRGTAGAGAVSGA